MKLFKQYKGSNLYQIHDLTDDQLIAFYNICINYKGYLAEILKKPDNILLSLAPGTDAKIVRHNLKLQEKTCDEYIVLWNKQIDPGKTNKNKN